MRLVFTFALLLAAPSAVSSQEQSFIRLQEIDGRTWLVDSDGQPFFAHGVTHVSGKHGEDVHAIGRVCRELGFNAFGYGCPTDLKSDLPYLEGRNFVPISMYRTSDDSFRFIDIFDPEEQARLEQAVRKVCFANRMNRNLIGYCWTDLGAWSLDNPTGRNWVDFVRALPADAAGQMVWQQFVRTWKGGDDTDSRDHAFVRIIAREYFRVFGEANRRFDPNHLIFGDRLTFQTAIPEVVEELLPYVDAIAIQPPFRSGFPTREFDRVHKLSGKPVIICDFAIRFLDGEKKIRGWKPEPNAEIAGRRYSEYIRAAMATPYIIGAFWCNPIDSTPGFRKTGIKQGLFDQGLTPRPELHRAIRELNLFLIENTPTN